ncbi:MAG: acyl--CoA ligase [Betaproteobacteria bacterium]|nr:acyl--CoA ligase [Betaproteobacteria bacterium]
MKAGAFLSSSAKRNPDRAAVIWGDRRVSFSELDARTNQIADALAKQGVRLGDRVALCLPNTIELIEVMGGVLKSGAVLVPVSGRLAKVECKMIFEEVEPAAIFFGASMREAALEAAAARPRPLLVAVGGAAGSAERDYEQFVAGGSPSAVISLPLEPDDALISYTSGTTGRPKGIVSTHSNMVVGKGFMLALEFGLRSDDVTLITTEIALSTGMARVTSSFCLGSTMVLMDHFDPEKTLDLIERERVTVIGLVPTIARRLIPEIRRRPQACRTLRIMNATGEAFPEQVMSELRELLPQLAIYSFYAQTEAGIVASLLPSDQLAHPGSVGRPLRGVEVRIVDENLKDVAPGEVGEILVRSGRPGHFAVMREYFRQPAATAEAFADGWLRTGDMGRFDSDGFLYLVDRVKDMIISGGLNIYSREVEAAIMRHPAVAEAAVVGVPDPEFGESVVAFVRLKSEQSATVAELIDHCRAQSAGYKKPRHIGFVDELPRNSGGKVMKRVLRARAAAEFAGAKWATRERSTLIETRSNLEGA